MYSVGLCTGWRFVNVYWAIHTKWASSEVTIWVVGRRWCGCMQMRWHALLHSLHASNALTEASEPGAILQFRVAMCTYRKCKLICVLFRYNSWHLWYRGGELVSSCWAYTSHTFQHASGYICKGIWIIIHVITNIGLSGFNIKYSLLWTWVKSIMQLNECLSNVSVHVSDQCFVWTSPVL